MVAAVLILVIFFVLYREEILYREGDITHCWATRFTGGKTAPYSSWVVCFTGAQAVCCYSTGTFRTSSRISCSTKASEPVSLSLG